MPPSFKKGKQPSILSLCIRIMAHFSYLFKSFFILTVGLPLYAHCQTTPITSDISGPIEVCVDESTSYSVNTTLQIVISEVDYNGNIGNDVLELKNVGQTTINISSWWICSRIRYNQLSSLNVVTGSLNLSPGNLVTLDGLTFDITNDSDVGLYATGSFGSPSAMRHFVKFGTSTSAVGRESVAVSAGLWTSTAPNQYDLIAAENDKTIEFDDSGILSTDWTLTTTSIGSANSVFTTYDWTVPSGATITENNGNDITVNWSGASNGNVSVIETNGDGGAGSVDLALSVNSLLAWYVDSDGDGFGDPDSTPIMSCDAITGRTSNDDDCDDNDVDLTNEKTWHQDIDGDGFGDPDNSQVSCTQPIGFVLNGTDCDDENDQVFPTQTWFVDSDGDGFGDPDNSDIFCSQPIGFVSNDEDCDDDDDNVFPGASAQPDGKDNDCDGTIDKVDQAITFSSIEDFTLSSGSITVAASASSELLVSFVVSGPAKISGNTVTPTDAGTVTVTASQSGDNRFNAALSVDQTFCVNPDKPTISVLNGQLTTGQEGIHNWSQDGSNIGNEPKNTISPVEESIYQVQITIDGCSSELSEEFQHLITGIQKQFEESIQIFPTLSSGSINIRNSGGIESDIDISIYDLSGARYFEQIGTDLVIDRLKKVSTTNLLPGIYMLRIDLEEHSILKRFVKIN